MDFPKKFDSFLTYHSVKTRFFRVNTVDFEEIRSKFCGLSLIAEKRLKKCYAIVHFLYERSVNCSVY